MTSFHDGVLGRIRVRSVGEPRGLPEIVLVQGLAVSDYLLPGLRSWGTWTRTHLLDLPGLAGSGEPPNELDIPDYATAVRDWVDAVPVEPVVLAGHSSGTQVAAEAAAGNPGLAGLVLASPTVDPRHRSLLRLTIAWQVDGRREPPGLTQSHLPEWRRAGPRRLLHLVRAQLQHDIEQPVRRVQVPMLVMRGRDDALSTSAWARHLSAVTGLGQYVEVAGAHTFPWRDPDAWSPPVRRFVEALPR